MTDYAYINSRIRSMEAGLLTNVQLKDLLSCRDLTALSNYLKKTHYGIYLTEGMEDSMMNTIDAGLRVSLSESMQKIMKLYSGGDNATPLIGILLGRWDLFNIKTLIRGKFHNVHAQEALSATVPAGSLDEAILQEIYKQPSVQTMIDMLITIGHSYVNPLKKIRYRHEGELFKGEVELEKAFFANAHRLLKASDEKGINRTIVEDVITMLIDRYNLITAIKLTEGGIITEEAVAYFIEGGRNIPLSVYRKMMRCRDASECISATGSDMLRIHYERFSAQSRITNPMLLMERWMDHEMLIHTARLPREDLFHIGLVISYIWKKVNEIINLRTIVRGIHYGLPQDEIEGLLNRT